MSSEMIVDVPELKCLEKSKADMIRATFEPMAQMIQTIESEYNKVIESSKKEINREVIGEARNLRLSISKIRIITEKARKEQKEEYLRAGKAIDGVANILKFAISDKEEKLEEIEKYFETQEKLRLEKLQIERETLLLPYVDSIFGYDLANMNEDVFNIFLKGKKEEKEAIEKAKIEVEKARLKAEEEAKIENERIRAENEKLKIEAEKQAKIEAERKVEQEKERKAYEAKIQAEKAEREKAEREFREKAELERKERERIQAKIEAKEEAERKAEAEKQARENNLKHRGKINSEIRDSFISNGFDEESATKIVKLIALNKIQHCQINY